MKLRIRGRLFAADACNCFDAACDREENFRLARRYWENRPNAQNQPPIIEYLADGEIEVLEIVKEIGKNICNRKQPSVPTRAGGCFCKKVKTEGAPLRSLAVKSPPCP